MISVIVPARNAADTIQACLEAILAQEGVDFEVILVDDGSTDRTAKIAEGLGVRVIRQGNKGPAAARNAGVEAALGDIIAFTDADCQPSPDWLLELIRPFADSEVIGAKGAYQTRQSGLVPRFVQQEYASKYVRMRQQEQIDFIDTYSAAYRKDVFLENKGFDTAFPAPSVEDQEFSFRLARKGYKMAFAPDAIVYHQHDADIREYARRKFFIGYWKAFMLRWVPEKALADTHTPGSQRWQIVFLGLAALSVLMVFFEPGLWIIVPALFLGLFGLTSVSILRHIWKADRKVTWITPGMLFLRAGALGAGLAAGFCFPTARAKPKTLGLGFIARFLKRGVDFVGGFLGCVLGCLLLPFMALWIKLDDGGVVFFWQVRAGENGKPFRMVKLRTMQTGAEERVNQVLERNRLNGPVYKIPDDPRVTGVGRFLRRWSLDEIPQFWNVLCGEMSLVGPRPEEVWVVEKYTDNERQRLAFKPGMTGPMQVHGRGGLDMDARLALELEYIEHYSLKRDLQILLQTIPAIIRGEGAF